MNYWLVATFNRNNIKVLEANLSNQEFEYYLPKIIIKKKNNLTKEEVLFPGYIFINSNLNKYTALKYTRGIKNIIKFGDQFSYLTNSEIEKIKMIEDSSIINPIESYLSIGKEVTISKGSFKGSIVKIISLPSKKRAEVLLYFLGSERRTSIRKELLEI